MDKKTDVVCVICCKAYRNKLGVTGKSVKCLKQFCEDILVAEGGGNNLREKFGFLWGDGSLGEVKWKKGGGGGGRRGRKKITSGKGKGDLEEDLEGQGSEVVMEAGVNFEEKLTKFVDNPDDNLGICGKCLEIMDSVIEARLSVKLVEERVEKLQMLLLREMRRLGKGMDVVWREFGRMEELKNGGDRRFMENCLDQSYLRPGKGKKGRQKVFGRISDEHWERKQEIWGFRGKISEVFSDLDKYHEEMKEKFSKKSGRIQSEVTRIKVNEAVVVKEEPMEEFHDDLEDNGNYFLEDNQADKVEDRLAASLDDDFDDGEGEPMDLDEFIDNLCENEEEDDNPSDENEEERDKPSLSEEEDDKEEEEDRSDDDDYTPINRTSRYRGLLADFEWHLSKLSPFKRGIVENVLKCQQRHENKKLENKNKPRSKILEAEALLTPYQRYMSKLSYHSESQTIYLSDIPIKIVSNSDGNGMLCKKCDFKIVKVESADIETQMYDHVLSKHLNAYHCPHCGDDNQLETDKEYRKHVKSCRESQNCDICGKPFTSGRGLQGHKWSHMNEEERKEAVEKGEMKAPRNLNLKDYPKIHQCQQCGKSFKFLGNLKKHEVVHQERSEREQFVCPKCGKSFLKRGFEYHIKWSDTCADQPVTRREQCLKCERTFKNKARLRNHVIMAHTEKGQERPFVCEICGKAFKIKYSLKEHGSVHTGEKRFMCGVCGTGFTRYSSMKRHEKNCGE